MNIEQVREYALSLPGVTEDQVFGDDIVNFRLEGKIFACLWLGGGKHDMKNGETRIAMKLTPERNLELRERHMAVTPAWHWNKTHWSDVYYEQLDTVLVKQWLLESHQLVASKLPKAIRSKYVMSQSAEWQETEKCEWCRDGGLLERYHDTEWGIPCHDDKRLFEYLMLECMSCGLSWNLMLRKREIFHACFANFDCKTVARFTEEDIVRAMEYPGMIKSRRKIEAIISNANRFMQVQKECGSFDRYLWNFTQGKTYIYQTHLDGVWITKNELSDRIAADLKKRGFKFLGSTLIYSYLQSVGIINDHSPHCPMFHLIGGEVIATQPV